jgi:hypothetical protein
MIIYEWIANLFIFAISLLALAGSLLMLPAAMDRLMDMRK